MIRRTALAALLCLAPAVSLADEVVVFAAASLKTALDQVAAEFEATSGHKVLISYGGSGQMAQQIIAGAPADIFVSAAPEWMDVIADEGLLVPDTRKDILGNTLVLIAHGPEAAPVALGPDFDLAAALGDGRLAMGQTASVPVGQYGKAALQGLGLWETVAPSVVEAENARAALMLVASGEAPFGIVFASDALASDDVTVVARFPGDSHPPIRYPAALLVNAGPAGGEFLAALGTPAAAARFTANGFEVLP